MRFASAKSIRDRPANILLESFVFRQPMMSCEESQVHKMEQDDTDDSLQRIVSGSGSDVVSHLLAIERHALEVRKAHVWAENPLCLVYEGAAGHHFRVIRNRSLERPFVAISWTWQASCHENAESGSYWAEHSHPRGMEKLQIRDCVLARVTKYLSHKGLELVWIDRVCIDQCDEKSKIKAMNSMDLIYQNAEKTLGLLSTPIESTTELRLLTRLMDGELTMKSPRGLPTFRPNIGRGTIENTIRILHRLTTDVWWSRAWIYQEEYLAGTKMDLIFPLHVERQGHSNYEQIPGEFCVSASFFRQEATLLLRAYQQSRLQKHRVLCDSMLEVIGKYQILLQHRSGGSSPMSATIHAEIRNRSLQNPWDRLAIAANACGYGIRLNHNALSDEHSSIAMSLLAQYLLNGEIFVLNRQQKRKTEPIHEIGAIGWMHITRLKARKLPATMKQLSFLKLCRLPNVSFCKAGVRTRGLIWHLKPRHMLRTPRPAYRRMSLARAARLCHEPWAAQEIEDLIDELRRRHRRLADRLSDYVQKRRRGIAFTACSYMDAMMWEIVQAVNKGDCLRIGYTQQYKCTGIFIPASCDIHRNMCAFTAWQAGNAAANSSDKFVSLRVDVRNYTVTSALAWVNGLVFFCNDDLQDVIFAWPDDWKS